MLMVPDEKGATIADEMAGAKEEVGEERAAG